MTRDNRDKIDPETGDPGPNLDPADVIQCRECGGMVRRVNHQHLTADRCKYTKPGEVRVGEDEREDLLREDHPTTVEEYQEKYPDAPVLSPREKAKLAKGNRDEETDERRREMLRRRWRGEDMSRIVDDLAEEYGVARNTVRKDWGRREGWIGRVFGLEDADAVVLESLAQKQDVRRRLLRVARRAEDQNDVNAAVRALKAVDANIDDTIEHQQELGNVERAATEHRVEVEGEVNHEHRHTDAGVGLDEDTLEQLDELTGGGEEVIDAEYEVVEDGGGG